MCIFLMHIKCADRFFEVLPDEVESTELTVENAVSHILLDLFGKGAVDEVTIRFPSNLRMGLPYCSIDIRAQCFCQFFSLLPRTQENMKHALVKSICSLLKELFGSVKIESVTLSPSPWNYEHDENNENQAKCCHQPAR
ncbi:MAG TPA: hypothetical protein VEL31_08060 [Ktedonobacteraceae bacterium]|nr:hypothetical protein [Ktedonobacteraceae bacterium]